ncbi:hypothetical protein NP493_591g02066 [Ridgeia piscesae]|uniref:TLC domain-containing protein n=1 Tax=Ridgeia piscesae TaxID=27915 RepID=A0AAD9NS97_RIDPI|nr:hypothetical protein NP493_591g02066 [Ridgeia piscesae]
MQGKLSEMQRFRETSWRFTFYLGIFATGLYVLWDKPWLWETAHCWIDYPRQHVPPEVWWYYIIELGFYCSLMLSLFMDGKRKDFYEMLVHHFATLSLLAFSWSNNMVRMGSTVTLLHDSVDYWLEGAKLAKYLRYQKLCDSLFIVFAVMWLITRIILYPIRYVSFCSHKVYCYK